MPLVEVLEGVQFQCQCGFRSEIFPVVIGREKRSHGLDSVLVRCPFCNELHVHSPMPMPDLRRSHCGSGGRMGAKLKEYYTRYPKAITGGSYYVGQILYKEKKDAKPVFEM
jgi:hypothetical protein